MKRIAVSLVIISMFFINIINVYAYDTSSYKINLPDEYVKAEKKNLWTLKTENSITTVSVEVIDNTSNIDINNIDNESLDESLLKELNESLNEKAELNVKTSNLSVVKVSNYNTIKMDIDSSLKTEDEFVSTIYQTQYIFSSKKYLYYLVVSSSDKELLASQDMNSIINSFTIKDDLEVKDKDELKKYYITLGVIVLSGVLIMLVVKRK